MVALTDIEQDSRWQAVVNRDPAADGQFVFSVRSTGVYCRPSCPSRPARRENVAFHANGTVAERAGFRPCKRCKPAAHGADLAPDWNAMAATLHADGAAVLPALLPPNECRDIAGLFAQDSLFRSHVVMARHGFGKGEYKYFAYPLPDLVQRLRAALYPHLVPIANTWNIALGIEPHYPAQLADFLALCHAAGQTRPTPLLLQYGPGDYNALHQDLYGDLVFPLQVAILLSEPERDFTGGEFVLTEQRPRVQSRAMVMPLRQGDAVVFAVHHRPARGTRGTYRVNLRHGVSRLHSGRRHTLGLIFHNAA